MIKMDVKSSLIIQIVLLICLIHICGCTKFEPSQLYSALPVDIELSEELSVKELTPGVMLVEHSFPYGSNSLVVYMGEKYYLLVDTPCTDQATAKLLDWLYATYGNEIYISAVNTGFHIDNLGGNEELAKHFIPIWGSDKTCELLDSRGKETTAISAEMFLSAPANKYYYDKYLEAEYRAPDHIFPLADGLQITFPNETIQAFYPGPSHTFDNVVVYFPKRKLLFGGCMIKTMAARGPGYKEDADMVQWPLSVAKVKDKFAEIDIVVPGHGPSGGTELLDHTIEILNIFNANNDSKSLHNSN